ncbi:MAG: hypothetical protein U9R53_03965 [Chloroflexota bacterium]|nr:hypothetical protein [Chloroflexota bacterium]
MDKSNNRRRMSVFLIYFASIGLLFSLLGISTPWIVKPRINRNLSEMLDLFSTMLVTTGDGLSVMDSTIEKAKTNLTTIVTTFDNLDSTFDSISKSLDTSASLIGDDLRLTVNDTQVALESSSSSAELIDKTLSFLAAIPLIGVDYQPEVPLHISLAQVAGNFEDIPDSLEDIEQGLTETTSGIDTLKGDLSGLTEEVQLLDDDLEDAQLVLMDYQETFDRIHEKTNSIEDNLKLYLTLMCIFISGTFFSLGTAQISMIILGIKSLHSEEKVVNLADIQRDSPK